MMTDDQGRALVALGVAAAAEHAKVWDAPGVAVAVRKLADLGDRPSTILAKLEAAAADPLASTPGAALWSKLGNTRPRPSAVEVEEVCELCGHGPDACPAVQAKVPPEFRAAHEFTPRRRPARRGEVR